MMIALFVISGLLWIVAFGILLRYVIKRNASKRECYSRTQFMWSSINASRSQHLMAYWALSMGVFTVFAVGLSRPDFSDTGMFGKASGGYQYYIDSRVPIQYDLNNSDVRNKLSLTELPDDTEFLHFLRHTADEASCLNLNKVETPTVLGVDLKAMESFGLKAEDNKSTDGSTKELGISSFYVDSEALIWSMMKSVGDTIIYKNGKGIDVPVVIAGSYPTGIFHGNAIMSQQDFRRLWPEESGVEVLLLKSSRPDVAAELLSIAMNEYGLNVQSTDERIKMFFEVTDTYLLIFLTLGGLGMLLGIFSLIIIVRKNLTAQQHSIEQYKVLGYRENILEGMLIRENVVVPIYAIVIGATGSLLSISANITGAGLNSILMALLCLALLIIGVYYGTKRIVKTKIYKY